MGSDSTWSFPKENGDLHKFYRLASVLETYLAHLKRIALEYSSARNYIMRRVLYWNEDDLVGSPAQAIKLEGCAHDLNAKCGDGRGEWFEGDGADCSVQKTPFPYAVDAGEDESGPVPIVRRRS
jgi:hypothetical protein